MNKMQQAEYITPEEVAKYLKPPEGTGSIVGFTFPTDLKQLTVLINFFARGAVTGVSNVLYEHMVEGDCELRYGIAPGCRCFGCYEWQLVDENGKVVVSVESLEDMWQIRERLPSGG